MSAYGTELENDLSLLKEDKISMETIKSVAECKYPPTDDWYHRVWFYNNLDPENIPYAEQKMKNYLKEHLEEIRQKVTIKKWFYGHYHKNRNVNAEEILLWEQIIRIS